MLKKLFKHYLIAGLLVLVPIILTVLILKAIIVNADSMLLALLPSQLHPSALFGFHVPGLGLVATVVIAILAGFFARLYIGKKAFELGDWIISKIPLGRTIYGSLKQLLGTLFSQDSRQFKGVAVVEYPRRGCYVLAFITGEPIPRLQNIDGEKKWINLFVPTTPNPTSGFWIMVPEEDVRPVDISTEYAFKLIISAGIVQEKPTQTPAT
jgi:uncharacterized membrane protein